MSELEKAKSLLIEAAPDLLEACMDLVSVKMPHITGLIHPVGSWEDHLRQAVVHAKEAIAKAKGVAN